VFEVPLRPDEAPAQRVRERRWLPALLIAALILMVAQGARTVADATAGATGPAVAVGSAVTLQPRPGWDLESTGTDPPTAEFHRGPVFLDVVAYPPTDIGPAAVAASYVEQTLRPGLAQVNVGSAAPTVLAGGVPAVRFGYVGITTDGVPLEGVVVVASGQTASVVFDAYAPQGELATVAGDVGTMIDGAVIR